MNKLIRLLEYHLQKDPTWLHSHNPSTRGFSSFEFEGSLGYTASSKMLKDSSLRNYVTGLSSSIKEIMQSRGWSWLSG